MKKRLFILLLLAKNMAFAQDNPSDTFNSQISPLPESVKVQVLKYTLHPGCPVKANKLAYVQMSYWGYDNKTHVGELIVNKSIAKEVVKIFQDLYNNHFPIQRMEPLYVYKGDDMAAMAANDTSGFNCRLITGTTNQFSRHSYGTAIDLNPLVNPYVNGDYVSPPNARAYVDRDKNYPGMVKKDSFVYQEFTKYGWHWGGNWNNIKDYQHFEKH